MKRVSRRGIAGAGSYGEPPGFPMRVITLSIFHGVDLQRMSGRRAHFLRDFRAADGLADGWP